MIKNLKTKKIMKRGRRRTLLTAEQTNLQPRTMWLRRIVKSPRDSGRLDCSFNTYRVMVIKSVRIASPAWSIFLFSLLKIRNTLWDNNNKSNRTIQYTNFIEMSGVWGFEGTLYACLSVTLQITNFVTIMKPTSTWIKQLDFHP